MLQYHLKALIGVGTFAEVWHANRVNEEGKRHLSDVALKIGLCHIDDERTERERTALYQVAPLQHPGTIRILDITSRDNRLVVAMELAEVNLLEMLAQSPSVADCLRYIGEVAATLDDLHTRHVLHGGINPTDILVLEGHAKIADFGPIPYGTAASRIPFYKAVCMAPELRWGEPTPESDQYALAATYAWLRLHHGAFPVPRRGELPSGIDLAGLPQSEKDVLLCALNPQPKQRFASCCAFVKAVKEEIEEIGDIQGSIKRENGDTLRKT